MRSNRIRSLTKLWTERRPEYATSAGDDPHRLQPALSRNWRSTLRAVFPRLDRIVQPAYVANVRAGPLPRGGIDTSRPRSADGSAVGQIGCSNANGPPRFDTQLAHNGYVWWYLDAVSDDGRHALTVIAFIGSVFSPYYALARRLGPADPCNHCAVNVVLYGEDYKYWTMTERGQRALTRTSSKLRIGPSDLSWDGNVLTINISEVTAPWPRRVVGTIRLHVDAIDPEPIELDTEGQHHWWPLAPRARVEVQFNRPELSWQGRAYHDANAGDVPLEQSFTEWHWSRTDLPAETLISYDVQRRDGSTKNVRIRSSGQGKHHYEASRQSIQLPPTLWRMMRRVSAENPSRVQVLKTLEDAPFYARSLLSMEDSGQTAVAVHESLDLNRFRRGWIQAMLGFRAPRAIA